MANLKLIILLPLLNSCICDKTDVIYVILSQNNKYNFHLASDLKNDIFSQYAMLQKNPPTVYLSHIDTSHPGGWTIFPLIPKLTYKLNNNNLSVSWIFFVEEYTKVRVEKLLDTLKNFNSNKDWLIGHALSDKSATIIHHFAFHDDPESFKYPNIASGFAININLLKKLSKIISEESAKFPDFNIDNSHEFALFVKKQVHNVTLQHIPDFCVKKQNHCATFPHFKLCNNILSNDAVYFAVKTCKQFHKDRIPVIKNTWGKNVNIKFFSHVEDDAIPTVNLGIPNTERGHCEKTLAIFKYMFREIEINATKADWFAIVDDDTILSAQRLSRLLSCYDPTENIALGERYGYHVSRTPPTGFNYITGGGGMIFSKPLVKMITKKCRCPSLEYPDDMFLGVCLQSMGIEILHSPSFHQARPEDYALGYLQSHHLVSFHKHWMVDPILIYREWLKEEKIFDNVHDEF